MQHDMSQERPTFLKKCKKKKKMISRHKSKVQKVVKFIIICSSVNDINKNTEEEKKRITEVLVSYFQS